MKIIEPSVEIMGKVDPDQMLKNMEAAGRVCYKSEGNIREDSAGPFLNRLIKSGHESVIEHEKLTVRLICDRGVTHQIVRHRIASYSQESTRYCNYTKNKFGNELTFIRPNFWEQDSENYKIWLKAMEESEKYYFQLIKAGSTPEEARAVLPNSLKTEIVITMNLREWRHYFKLRTSQAAHPQIRQVSNMILDKFIEILPEIFTDIKESLKK